MISKKKWAFLIVFVVTSCSHFTPNEFHKPVCRHNAVLSALVFGEKYLVRIAHGPAFDVFGKRIPDMNHAQAQAFVINKWEWLEFRVGVVVVGNKDWWFKPNSYATVEEAMRWSKQVKFIGD